jgi:hypothetical protein
MTSRWVVTRSITSARSASRPISSDTGAATFVRGWRGAAAAAAAAAFGTAYETQPDLAGELVASYTFGENRKFSQGGGVVPQPGPHDFA